MDHPVLEINTAPGSPQNLGTNLVTLACKNAQSSTTISNGSGPGVIPCCAGQIVLLNVGESWLGQDYESATLPTELRQRNAWKYLRRFVKSIARWQVENAGILRRCVSGAFDPDAPMRSACPSLACLVVGSHSLVRPPQERNPAYTRTAGLSSAAPRGRALDLGRRLRRRPSTSDRGRPAIRRPGTDRRARCRFADRRGRRGRGGGRRMGSAARCRRGGPVRVCRTRPR